MSRVLRSLHIGVGNRGRWPLECATPDIGFQPVALCDPDPAILAAASKLTGVEAAACYQDVSQALNHPGLDCVIICAPTRFHVPLTKQALAQGLPALVEKGMAPDFASAVDLVAAVEKAGIPVCVSQNYRYNAIEQTIGHAIHNPRHPAHPGVIHSVNYVHHRVRPQPRTLNYPFASVWDMSCHHFDNLLYWLGPVANLHAVAYAAPWSAYEHANNTASLMRFAGGAAVTYEHTHDAARQTLLLAFHGERGALWLEDGKLWFSERPTEQFGRRPAQEVPLVDAPAERGVLKDFHQYVTEDVEPGISARQNLEVMAMCQMMVESITRGGTVARDQITLSSTES